MGKHMGAEIEGQTQAWADGMLNPWRKGRFELIDLGQK